MSMLDIIKDKIGSVLNYIRGYGRLTEENIKEAARKVRLALLEADVNYSVVREFTASLKEKAMDKKILSSMTPAQAFFGLVRSEIRGILQEGRSLPEANKDRIQKFILFGPNGSGKTSSAVKLALFYKKADPTVVAADLTRPAAIDQLEVQCKKLGIRFWSDRSAGNTLSLVKAFLKDHTSPGPVIFDTAGRFETDQALLDELHILVEFIKPDHKFLVVDAAEGQGGLDSVVAIEKKIGIDSIFLSKMDSDARGGVVLSLKMRTDLPVSCMAVGEHPKDLEMYSPDRIADRIMGLVVPDERLARDLEEHLMEAADEDVDPRSMDLEQFLKSLSMLERGGLIERLVASMPGMPAGAVDKKELVRFRAIIQSMTRWERTHPDGIEHKRRLRIAAGSGTDVKDVNILLKRFRAMRDMMNKFGRRKGGKKDKLADMLAQIKGGISLGG